MGQINFINRGQVKLILSKGYLKIFVCVFIFALATRRLRVKPHVS